MAEPRGVFWDLDGTLVDSTAAHRHAYEAVLAVEGVTGFHYASFAGYRTEDVFLALGFEGEKVRELTSRKRRLALQALRNVEPMPYATDAVEHVRARGWFQGVVTGGSEVAARAVLARTGLAAALEILVTAETPVRSKPSAEPFLHAAARKAIAPAEVVVVEDSHDTAVAAARAGFGHVFLVGSGTFAPPNGRLIAALDSFIAWLRRT